MDSLQKMYYDRYRARCDKGTRHTYIEVYEKLFRPYRDTATDVIEIGVFKGGSIDLWTSYFTRATVHGVDVKPCVYAPEQPDRVRLYISDSADGDRLHSALEPGLMYDVIIDDGCHKLNTQKRTFTNLYPLLKPGGVYVIEDVTGGTPTIQKLTSHCELAGATVHVTDRREIKRQQDDVLVISVKPELVP